jgi:hypothetical protein
VVHAGEVAAASCGAAGLEVDLVSALALPTTSATATVARARFFMSMR